MLQSYLFWYFSQYPKGTRHYSPHNKDKLGYKSTSFDWNNEDLVVWDNNTKEFTYATLNLFHKNQNRDVNKNFKCHINGIETPKRSYNENEQSPSKNVTGSQFIYYNYEQSYHMSHKYRNMSTVALPRNLTEEKLTVMTIKMRLVGRSSEWLNNITKIYVLKIRSVVRTFVHH